MSSEGTVQVLIGLGSNIEAEAHFTRALQALSKQLNILGISTVFRSPAIGRPEQPEYLNTVVLVETTLDVLELKGSVLVPIEFELGRVRNEDRYAARTIDLDIVLYGELVLHRPGLTIPDPDLGERAFLAAGAAELLPDAILPGTQKPLRALCNTNEIAKLQIEHAFTDTLRETFIQ